MMRLKKPFIWKMVLRRKKVDAVVDAERKINDNNILSL